MWQDRSKLKTIDDFESRIRALTSRFRGGDRSEDLLTEIEVMVAAAFLDPVAQVRGGEMALSRALPRYLNSSIHDFKTVYAVGDFARSVGAAYAIAKEIVGPRVAEAILEDVLIETGDPIEASVLVFERMVCPTRRFHPVPPAASAAQHQHGTA